jgi:hypothetical protein
MQKQGGSAFRQNFEMERWRLDGPGLLHVSQVVQANLAEFAGRDPVRTIGASCQVTRCLLYAPDRLDEHRRSVQQVHFGSTKNGRNQPT